MSSNWEKPSYLGRMAFLAAPSNNDLVQEKIIPTIEKLQSNVQKALTITPGNENNRLAADILKGLQSTIEAVVNPVASGKNQVESERESTNSYKP